MAWSGSSPERREQFELTGSALAWTKIGVEALPGVFVVVGLFASNAVSKIYFQNSARTKLIQHHVRRDSASSEKIPLNRNRLVGFREL